MLPADIGLCMAPDSAVAPLQDELYGMEGRPAAASRARGENASSFVDDVDEPPHHGPQWALINFDRPITVRV